MRLFAALWHVARAFFRKETLKPECFRTNPSWQAQAENCCFACPHLKDCNP